MCVCAHGGGCCAFFQQNLRFELGKLTPCNLIWQPCFVWEFVRLQNFSCETFCVSSHFIRSFDTSPRRDQCPLCERKHQKEHCVVRSGKGIKKVLYQRAEISSDKDLWRPYKQQWDTGGHPTEIIVMDLYVNLKITDVHRGFCVLFLPLNLPVFCYFNCLWFSVVRGQQHLVFVPTLWLETCTWLVGAGLWRYCLDLYGMH